MNIQESKDTSISTNTGEYSQKYVDKTEIDKYSILEIQSEEEINTNKPWRSVIRRVVTDG